MNFENGETNTCGKYIKSCDLVENVSTPHRVGDYLLHICSRGNSDVCSRCSDLY